MWDDPIVSEVREVREQLARQFDFDVHRTFADLRKRQILLGSKLVRRQKREKADQATASAQHSIAPHPGR
jgi:multidrug resistance efflux pump